MSTVTRTGTVEVVLPSAAALDLFTAPGEALWVPGWTPQYIDPPDGAVVVGGIWTTEDKSDDGTVSEVIWRVQRFDRAAGIAEYLRIVPGNRISLVAVHCVPHPTKGAAHTQATVSYTITPLAPAGKRWLAAFDDAAYAKMMSEWQRLLAAYLRDR